MIIYCRVIEPGFGTTEVSLLDEFAARIYEELDYNKVPLDE